MKRYTILFLILSVVFILAVKAEEPENIIGVWRSSSEDLMIKIDKIGNHYQGRIIWVNGQNREDFVLDGNNPDEKLRKLPLKGSKIIQELSFNSKNSLWEGGTFYNHMEGKHYNCRIELTGINKITISKYLSSPAETTEETWVRYK